MIDLTQTSLDQYISIKLSGKVTKVEYIELASYLEGIIKQKNSIDILCKLDNFRGIELSAMWLDIKFKFTHTRKFNRAALVGAPKWMEATVLLLTPVYRNKIKCFAKKDLVKATEWIMKKS